VLDLGFNLIRSLPGASSFAGVPGLTLLALDGNPMATLPEEAFSRLGGSLRGLSLGGRFLACDCRLRWVARWIAEKDLQVNNHAAEEDDAICILREILSRLNVFSSFFLPHAAAGDESREGSAILWPSPKAEGSQFLPDRRPRRVSPLLPTTLQGGGGAQIWGAHKKFSSAQYQNWGLFCLKLAPTGALFGVTGGARPSGPT